MTIEEALERVREKITNPTTANGLLFTEALRLILDEVERLKGKIERLGSSEAFHVAWQLDPERDRELIMRMEFARAALSPEETT